MSRLNSIVMYAALVGGMLLGSRTAGALEIEEARWGFDGQAMQHRFNLLSVLVSNPTGEAFDGGMSLTRGSVPSHEVGAMLRQPVFLSPYSRKWLQFHPYVKDQHMQYRLQWGPGHDPRRWGRRDDQRYQLNQLRLGRPAHVILIELGALLGGTKSNGLKGMPENLFPPIVTATDGLAGVVLNHNPRWQKPRREAFRDWLLTGGTVHVIKGDDGQYPQFSGAMAELNSPLASFAVGQGMVYRHDITRNGLTKNFVQSQVLNPRNPANQADDLPEIQRGAQSIEAQNADTYGVSLDDELLKQLKELTQPEHSWWLIYLMALCYLLMIFPGGYLLGRKRIDYRIIIAALLGTITIFSIGFSVVGARGYDERTAVNTLAIARPLPDNTYDLSTWSNTFVTRGGDYRIVQPGQGSLYSTCQSFEAVAGFISDDPSDRMFFVDIPPFSSRPFTARTKAAGQPLDYKVDLFQGAAALEEFALTPGTNLANSLHEAYLLYGDRLYRLRQTDKQWKATPTGQRLQTALNIAAFDPYANRFPGSPFGPERAQKKTIDELYRVVEPTLLTRALELPDANAVAKFQLPRDRGRLLLVADLPPEFFVSSEELNHQSGRVVYVIDVLKEQ